jgi:SH3-like domain-containing protein
VAASRQLRVALIAAGAVWCAGAQAAEFRSVRDKVAVLYDAPSRAAKPLAVVSKDYPLEVVVNLEAWAKVRDHTGALEWVEKRSLGDRRMVMVTVPSAEVRVRPDDSAPLAFVAGSGVVLELVEIASGGWLRVRHADGTGGYVRATQVWGG